MHTLIQTAIDTYQIFPAIVMFILSPLITFDKDLSDIPPEQQEPEAQKFLDQVPFQNVLSYRFATQTKQKIIAANKDFVLTMKTAFEKRTFPVTAVVPLVAVQEIMPELIENLDLTLLLAKIETQLTEANVHCTFHVPSDETQSIHVMPSNILPTPFDAESDL